MTSQASSTSASSRSYDSSGRTKLTSSTLLNWWTRTMPRVSVPDGEPYIIPGQQRPAGVEYPLAMIIEFRKVRQGGSSDREDELHEITANVTVFDRADPRDHESNLRKTQAQMGTVETACYDDRDLGGTCETLWVDEATALELETDRGDETAGSIDLTIQKTATHPY